MKKEEYIKILNHIYKTYPNFTYSINFNINALKYIGMLSGVCECAIYDEEIELYDFSFIIAQKTKYINLILYNKKKGKKI